MGTCVVGVGAEVPFKRELAALLLREFGEDAVFLKKVPAEDAFYDYGRGQHDAEKLLRRLRRQCAGCDKAFGVTGLDLFVPGLNFVFGLSELSGRAGILSTARLRSARKALFRRRFLKESLHELGHLHGLPHCEEECVMRFSDAIGEVDEKPASLCARCRERLRRGRPGRRI